MATELTTNQWVEILLDKNLTNELDISIFQALYSFADHKAYASQIGLILGNKGKTPHSLLNLEIGRYAKRIANQYEINFTESKRKYQYWDLFFNGWNEGKYFTWQLRLELVKALEKAELTGEEQLPEELSAKKAENLFEGIKRTITINSYERNLKARQQCVKHWGTACSACGFDFEKSFGELGKGFIHVHHLIPVSQIGLYYQVDPIKDLRPVCPNCHSMLHKQDPPLTIEELKQLISNNLK